MTDANAAPIEKQEADQMIGKLKKSAVGKVLYRASKQSFGAPIRLLARAAQTEALNVAHLKPANRAHNTAQRRILHAFTERNAP